MIAELLERTSTTTRRAVCAVAGAPPSRPSPSGAASWRSLGIIAAELGLAMGATVFVRRWIGYRTWHVVLGLSYPIFVFSLLHAIGTGTDSGTLWAQALYGGSVLLVLGAIVRRTARFPRLQIAVVVGSLVVALAVLRLTA